MKTTLDKYEKKIEHSAHTYRPVSKKKLEKIETILDTVKKTRKINITLSETVLAELKKQSQEKGISYQTLIANILHNFVTHRYVR